MKGNTKDYRQSLQYQESIRRIARYDEFLKATATQRIEYELFILEHHEPYIHLYDRIIPLQKLSFREYLEYFRLQEAASPLLQSDLVVKDEEFTPYEVV
jgi:hypothetical protein